VRRQSDWRRRGQTSCQSARCADRIRKVIFLLASTGAAEIVLVFLALLFGMPLPLFPLQLLWLNLVTNGIQHIALVVEPEEGHELGRAPRSPGVPAHHAGSAGTDFLSNSRQAGRARAG
jgi:magnesium-transporting ATPase (P-type)